MDDRMLRCRDLRHRLAILGRRLLVLSDVLGTLLVLRVALAWLLGESTVIRDVILRIIGWPLRLLVHLLLRRRLLLRLRLRLLGRLL